LWQYFRGGRHDDGRDDPYSFHDVSCFNVDYLLLPLELPPEREPPLLLPLELPPELPLEREPPLLLPEPTDGVLLDLEGAE
jgi:hypothetical protein